MDLTGKVVLITGASQGIGAALARALLKKGAKVSLAARSTDKLEKLAEELEGEVITVTADVTSQEEVQKMVDVTAKHFGRIDVLVNNAGQGLYGALEHVSAGDFERILRLNVVAPVVIMREVVPIMRKQGGGGGVILNVSSLVSKDSYPYIGAYAATKCALDAITLAASAELAQDGIMVLDVHPGLTNTDFGAHAIKVDAIGRSIAERTKPPAPGADSPERVADSIVRAIETGKAEE